MADSSPDSCFKGGAPGFRFHPTDEELLVYYLKRKICRRRLRVNVIGVVDVYKWDPEELPGRSLLKSGDRQWFFFTPRSRKYPNGARSTRCTANGHWKVTGRDRTIVYNSRAVGIKKTLVFYRGRAPNGERTDWVMHEYTMDEEELGKCQNAKDYYALYKLYQKSGAGPKNGEQYGALFKEEEWADDDKEDTTNVAETVTTAVKSDGVDRVDGDVLTQDDIEELLRGIADAPPVSTRQISNLPFAIPQVNGEEDIQNALVNTSPGEILVCEQIGEFMQYNNRHVSFDSLVSTNSFEATEVTSATPQTMEAAPLVFEKEDYIEMDDLLIPDLDASAIEKPLQPLNTDEFNSLSEFELLFHDVAMSFDMENTCQGTASCSSSMNYLANDTADEKQHYPNHQFQQQTLQSQPNILTVDPNQLSGYLWLQGETADQFDGQQCYSETFVSPLPGGSTDTSTSPSTRDQGDRRSRFSDALWAFMESIPSTPASACEGPRNRAFVRMSSFSRIRVAAKANRGFLVLSILAALCAILSYVYSYS